MHNRTIRQNKFNLPSMRKLWKSMGGYDALVEYNECAVRQFIRSWEEHKDHYASFGDFIRNRSNEVGINLGYIDIDQYRQEMYLWYLIHPYGCIDTFVREFKEDLKIFGYDIKLDFNDKSSLEKLMLGMKESGIEVTVDSFKLDLDKYYHRSRNLFTHKLDDKEKDKVASLYGHLQKDKIFEFYPTLTAALPAPCQYTFDDYTLCTANLKNISDTLTTDVHNSIDWNKFDINNLKVAIHLKRFLQNEKRMTDSIRTFIRQEYGVALLHDDIIVLKNKIME